ncbi:5-amino-6-(D-ribitylamino)uracil--L-tyrosine 4-hydroxyphenyl transferase CofH [Pseudomaricurvus alkylphenolicus]|uniref:5-amino-6-(D-ribitylamino)uracil--L-tyrosine 4-hydroxyphenyl transferase CofH n=1 Tax=Pseudomaricurvus alkylphenolicus TaxID=1306991 RepID=UPI0014220B05|nr:5-amino-6-(D-ribitylamino)uracil--L-tyrosine 4-hydroxyphenyl transferase CofH [Pseudomaricurvus alkylphenolicus]NIB42154.1 5-amino-6-(D-ribitylamino)uracil--L-tyrosine 4-hydroxyphenyl transferase CofH [Pseudomaricurvus alkylphenolicus]
MSSRHDHLLNIVGEGAQLTTTDARQLAESCSTQNLMAAARRLRDGKYGKRITYSRKVFIPLTQLCRNHCHYCTFAQPPKQVPSPYLGVEEVMKRVHDAQSQGCKEVLLTLGEKPEKRYRSAKQWLRRHGFETTVDYLASTAETILRDTGLLPHINAGTLTIEELAKLRRVSASMGIMLESASERLCEKGGVHYGSPDKHPKVRLKTIEQAGQLRVPLTTGLLIGIGETRQERVESLLQLRQLHRQYGHLQEIIIQNFRAKPDTRMSTAPEPDLEDLQWTLAMCRLIFGADMNIQVPPNLNEGLCQPLLDAGINDWGGISPVTPDYVNPEAPWPGIQRLAALTARAGKQLRERLTIYPEYALNATKWLDSALQPSVLRLLDGQGLARSDNWLPGTSSPPALTNRVPLWLHARVEPRVEDAVKRACAGMRLDEEEIAFLFSCRGEDLEYLCRQADKLRERHCGNTITYVVNRNINYTNICYFKCQFCAFSKGKLSENLRGRPYQLELSSIEERVREACQRGATEVCLQGGIHPEFTGQTYLDILAAARRASSNVHIHAFSPLEVWQGAKTLSLELEPFLCELKSAGLNSMPGTAAEILADEVRQQLCPDKINTEQWLQVMGKAHKVGLPTTATIMFGHIDQYKHWARHLLAIRDLQERSGGFTEFVPLPFVSEQTPLYLKSRCRPGPTFEETLLVHAVARLVLNPLITNIQTSWVKMGLQGAKACLEAGANDLGGTLMNESITRAAGAVHGQEVSPRLMQQTIRSCVGRLPQQRNTLYQPTTDRAGG